MRNLGQKTERQVLKKIGAYRQPASGAIPGIPNDGILGRYLLEVKSTEKKSLSIKRKWLEDLWYNAAPRGKTAAMIVVFNWADRALGAPTTSEWVVISMHDFQRLTKGWTRS